MASQPPAAAPALPSVAGFTFTPLETVPKIDKLISVPSGKDWTEMMDQIRETGDITDKPTKRGFMHPCATEKLRCDHQNILDGGYVNTQVQLGGTKTQVTRSDPSRQSTSCTQVNIHQKCYNNPSMVKLTLASAHEYSWRTKKVVQLDVASAPAASTSAVKSWKCRDCKKTWQAENLIMLGLRLNGYPPFCSCRDDKKGIEGSLQSV